jgi:hypothetical protein
MMKSIFSCRKLFFDITHEYLIQIAQPLSSMIVENLLDYLHAQKQRNVAGIVDFIYHSPLDLILIEIYLIE